jgi:hypothetical protein
VNALDAGLASGEDLGAIEHGDERVEPAAIWSMTVNPDFCKFFATFFNRARFTPGGRRCPLWVRRRCNAAGCRRT